MPRRITCTVVNWYVQDFHQLVEWSGKFCSWSQKNLLRRACPVQPGSLKSLADGCWGFVLDSGHYLVPSSEVYQVQELETLRLAISQHKEVHAKHVSKGFNGSVHRRSGCSRLLVCFTSCTFQSLRSSQSFGGGICGLQHASYSLWDGCPSD